MISIDLEVNSNGRVADYGAISDKGEKLHTKSAEVFDAFVKKSRFICGHNIVEHDLKYCSTSVKREHYVIDTLYMSPILFPSKPYHRLVKDDKIISDQLNNPVNDAQNALELFFDEEKTFKSLPNSLKYIFSSLLHKDTHFSGFFEYVGKTNSIMSLDNTIRRTFAGKICENVNIREYIDNEPISLAYSLALLTAKDRYSVMPSWVMINYPKTGEILQKLAGTPCKKCDYCERKLDAKNQLKRIFGFNSFRTYDGEPLQEKAAEAALNGKSLLAIFPTGGGKSITFQLPALVAGETVKGLTVVISPLQSLMKDQVDNLNSRGIADAVTINGLLNCIERSKAMELVENGTASLLYISPEMLRSKSVEKLLLERNVVRFVIDEAHCFSAWGQDFRVDYLFIGDFIRRYCSKKNIPTLPVSCFTATAKQKVITDIQEYFEEKLGISLDLYTTNATRKNLHYKVIYVDGDNEKYAKLRDILQRKACPAIVYVSSVKSTFSLAEKLTTDGIPALPFNGKMDSDEKVENQEKFMQDNVKVMVATSAFGMGVDKKNVGLVVHYQISDSLENYVQEAGRAGRDETLQAECYVLFNENDLDKHFLLLNNSKLSINEIQQIWKAIKELSKNRETINCSALELARQAGWDDDMESNRETQVKAAISALEKAGYIERGMNTPHVYATSIMVANIQQASQAIDESSLFLAPEKEKAKRIIKSLISAKNTWKNKTGGEDAESRVDYLADKLGMERHDVIDAIDNMRQIGILSNANDIHAYIKKNDNENKSKKILMRYFEAEKYLYNKMLNEGFSFEYKKIVNDARKEGLEKLNEKTIKTVFYFWTITGIINKSNDGEGQVKYIFTNTEINKFEEILKTRFKIAGFIIEHLFDKLLDTDGDPGDDVKVEFSLLEIKDLINSKTEDMATNDEIKNALLYLLKIGSVSIDGSFLVSYNSISIKRLVMDNKIQYKRDDYAILDDYYKQKIQQIHIVGEYAKMMLEDYDSALEFVNDYFQMQYKAFISKYFKGDKAGKINRNITPERYDKIFGVLSDSQKEIIDDGRSQYISVLAGPGSGKTRVLVHKLASLLMLEDVKSDQLLMLTFSRAATTEFKERLIGLIGSAAYYVEIKTFHSFAFDLLGQIGTLEESQDVIKRATEMIAEGETEQRRITKSVLVIDEAQDMDEDDYLLVSALKNANENMRIIAVGDDDQNIFEFRNSNSKYMTMLLDGDNSKKYELTENYRSDKTIVDFSNAFAKNIANRLKTSLITAVSKEKGKVELIHYHGENMVTGIVSDVISSNLDGSTCVLAFTNDETRIIAGLLHEKGINVTLVGEEKDFKFMNVAQMRFFLKKIDQLTGEMPVIDDSDWDNAVESLKRYYPDSEMRRLVLRALEKFSVINKKKYHTDFKEFVYDSKISDFYDNADSCVFVSTIHKSKGHEFDNVYILLSPKMSYFNEEQKHAFYVGITRAKKQLKVYHTSDALDKYHYLDVGITHIYNDFPKPEVMLLDFGYSDVFLDYFIEKKKFILENIRGEEQLEYRSGEFLFNGKALIRLSKNALQRLEKYMDGNYVVDLASVRCVVAWKKKETDEEHAIVLPRITLRLNSPTE